MQPDPVIEMKNPLNQRKYARTATIVVYASIIRNYVENECDKRTSRL